MNKTIKEKTSIDYELRALKLLFTAPLCYFFIIALLQNFSRFQREYESLSVGGYIQEAIRLIADPFLGMAIVVWCSNYIFWSLVLSLSILGFIRVILNPTADRFNTFAACWIGLWFWPSTLFSLGFIHYCGP